MALQKTLASARTSAGDLAPRPWLAPSGRTQQHGAGAGPRAGRRALDCRAAARPFGAPPPPPDGRQPLTAPQAIPVSASAELVPAVDALEEAPPVGEQLEQLRGLMARLGRAATYGDKIDVLMSLPAVEAFFSTTREGRMVARELADLAPKDAYCLACLPAIHQQHVLALVPTGVPVTAALAQLGAALARVEDFYDSIGGLVGYQAQCLALIAQQQQQQASANGSTGSSTNGSSSSNNGSSPNGSSPSASSIAGSMSGSSSDSLCSTDDAWPPGLAQVQQGGAADGSETELLVPVGLDLASPANAAQATAAVAAGIAALPSMAEVYPLGGAGDRLGLRCERTGESLPTAVLQYCGRSLLENLVRDLQGREYLYWKLHGTQLTTPVAIMTSPAKGNHWRVQQLFEEAGWFGRGTAAFRLFQQPLVPMVTAEDGRWLLQKPLQLVMKPGGHGVIWKLMIDAGVFDWLAGQGREAAIVRQISNPMAGTDNTLLALAGAGFPQRRSFGFASCERMVGASEGMNVLAQERRPVPASVAAAAEAAVQLARDRGHQQQQQPNGQQPPASLQQHVNNAQQQHVNASRHLDQQQHGSQQYQRDQQRYQFSYRVTNVEYTEFERLGVTDSSVDEESTTSVFPANTNVLYVGLPAVESTVRSSMAAGSTDAVLPGMILNLSKRVAYADPLAGGAERSVAAGRLECTMQNLADCLAQSFPGPLEECEDKAGLDTFLVYNQRRKVTSSAKRKLKPGTTRVAQTPDGSFLDLQRNAADLLANHCGMAVPEVGSVEDYLAHGPGFVFLAHPALGPLWSVVGQKIRGGSLAPRSECQLEVAEACLRDLHVSGSLLVLADRPLGHVEEAAGAPLDGRPRRANSLLEALLSPATNSSFNGLNGVEPSGGSVSSPEDDEFGGYSQPCNPTPAACGLEEGAESRLVYSQRCGRVRLHNVRVENAGVEWEHAGNVWWRHSLVRRQACRVLLRGASEFEARDVTLSGDLTFEVPDGFRLLLTPGPDGGVASRLERLDAPTWHWQYRLSTAGNMELELLEQQVRKADGSGAAASA